MCILGNACKTNNELIQTVIIISIQRFRCTCICMISDFCQQYGVPVFVKHLKWKYIWVLKIKSNGKQSDTNIRSWKVENYR